MSKRKGMGSHQSHIMQKDEWLTPPYILEALGPFDLDPAAPIERPWDMAQQHYTTKENGLKQPWSGRVWCNPPYGTEAAFWLELLADHGNGIALIFARTDTKMFFEHVWEKADALLFIKGRLYFHHRNGERAKKNGGAPSVLIAYGSENVERLKKSNIVGKLIIKIQGSWHFKN